MRGDSAGPWRSKALPCRQRKRSLRERGAGGPSGIGESDGLVARGWGWCDGKSRSGANAGDTDARIGFESGRRRAPDRDIARHPADVRRGVAADGHQKAASPKAVMTVASDLTRAVF
jgi:hypothetical protein